MIVASYSRQVSELSDARGVTRAVGEVRRDETAVARGAKVLVCSDAPVNGETKAIAKAAALKQRVFRYGLFPVDLVNVEASRW